MTSHVFYTDEILSRIKSNASFFQQVVHTQLALFLPAWDEVAVAVGLDPTIVNETISAHMDVDTSGGLFYGYAVLA